jgi:tetratricopeptide (TPR) repeat protein
VILLSNRLARPLLAAIMAMALVPATSAQSGATNLLDMLQLYRSSPTGSYLAGRQALNDLQTDEAARYFNEAAQGDWDNPVLVERSFIAFAANGQISQSAQVAKRLTELVGQNELAELVVATQALKERRYGATESALATVSQDTFTGITAGILRAWALVGEKRYDEADALITKLGSTGLEDFLVFHRALMAEVAGNKAKALELAAKAYENEPYVARMVEVYSRMLANDGRFDEAAEVIDSFESQGLTYPLVTVVKEAVQAKRRPGVFATSVQIGAAEMFHGIGVALSRDGSKDLALVFLRLGYYLDPNADVIGLAAGMLLDSSGQHEAANKLYDAVSSSSAMKPTAVVRIAQNLDSMGDRAEALRRLRNIVATRPNDLDAVSVLGDLLRYDEQYVEAAEAYTKALEITGGEAPADWRFYYVRGIAYERAKEWPKAEADSSRRSISTPNSPRC